MSSKRTMLGASVRPPFAARSECLLRNPAKPGRNIAFFVALFATALALGAAMAHALELPNKIGLPREDYFVVTALRHADKRKGRHCEEAKPTKQSSLLYWIATPLRGSR